MTKFKCIAMASLTLATIGLATSFAANGTLHGLAAGKGTLKGKITNSKGSPAVGCPIKLFAPINNAGGKSSGFEGAIEPSMLQGKNVVLTSANADAQGAFEMKAPLEPGKYRWMAGNRNFGLAAGSVDIAADQTATIEVTLNAPPGAH